LCDERKVLREHSARKDAKHKAALDKAVLKKAARKNSKRGALNKPENAKDSLGILIHKNKRKVEFSTTDGSSISDLTCSPINDSEKYEWPCHSTQDESFYHENLPNSIDKKYQTQSLSFMIESFEYSITDSDPLTERLDKDDEYDSDSALSEITLNADGSGRKFEPTDSELDLEESEDDETKTGFIEGDKLLGPEKIE